MKRSFDKNFSEVLEIILILLFKSTPFSLVFHLENLSKSPLSQLIRRVIQILLKNGHLICSSQFVSCIFNILIYKCFEILLINRLCHQFLYVLQKCSINIVVLQELWNLETQLSIITFQIESRFEFVFLWFAKWIFITKRKDRNASPFYSMLIFSSILALGCKRFKYTIFSKVDII